MAHSIEIVGQRVEHFNDRDLIATMSLMIDEVQQAPGKYPQVEELMGLWIQMLVGYGPGVIEMNLELIASSQESRSCFDRLLSAIETKVKRFGEVVPSSFLNDRCRVRGVSFFDYSPVLLTDVLDKLRRLVSSS